MLCALFIPALLHADSYYTLPLHDSHAVYLEARDNGIADAAPALQAAIDRVQKNSVQGIVFVPEGKYRLSHTVFVWEGIRLIGYGRHRPVFILGKNTPGYQDEKIDQDWARDPDADTAAAAYVDLNLKKDPKKKEDWGDDVTLRDNSVIHFVAGYPKPGKPMKDANPGTFYSGMSNIDIEIRNGNPAAIGVRFHVAQHCYLAHIDFHIGSGRAGIEDIGNEAEDCHFFGGQYGIIARKASPSWPFLLIDSSFDGQARAAIITEEAGLTLIRDHFQNAPSAIIVRPNRAEELFMTDSRLEDISGPALVISEEESARTQINLKDVVCARVPFLASFRDSGKTIAGTGAIYQVKDFCHGLQIDDLGAAPEIKTTNDSVELVTLPPPVASDIPDLPPRETWANFAALGGRGDGITNNTVLLKKAIATHRVIYFPTGRYRVSNTIELRPDTVLIGLSPITTQLVLLDGSPAFTQPGPPVPLLLAPKNGTNIVTGMGLDTGINNSAVAVKWMAGENSMMNDVRFIGGHGVFLANGKHVEPYNNNHTGDPDKSRPWDSQFYSLWITGGGTFKDIWTPDTYAQAGVCVTDTATPGRLYAISSEHHVRNEVKLRNVSNWKIDDLQTEEERGEGPIAIPLSLDHCSNITVANFFIYRIESLGPYSNGIEVHASPDITFRGIHAYSPGKTTFDNTIFDTTWNTAIREREIASAKISGQKPASSLSAPAFIANAKVEKCAGGFANIDGAVADSAGGFYFLDALRQRIYHWTPGQPDDLTLVLDSPIKPVALAVDCAENLLIVAQNDTVYSLPPDGKEDDLAVLKPVPPSQLLAATSFLPVNSWRDIHDFVPYVSREKKLQYVSPDGTAFIPAGVDYTIPKKARRGALVDLLRAYALAPGKPGHNFYVSDEFDQKTWSFVVTPDGTLGSPKLFAQEGEAGTAMDPAGNVYIAAGNISVYDSTGKKLGVIEVPERPTSLVFAGKDGRTLYVTARTSLYAVHIP